MYKITKQMPVLCLACVVLAGPVQAATQDSFGSPASGYPQQPPSQQDQYPSPPTHHGSPPGGYPQQPGFQQPGYAAPQQQGFRQPGYAAPQQQGFRQPSYSAPQQPGFSQTGYGAPQTYGTNHLDQLSQMERQDFGIAPTKQLHTGAMHGPTPTGIPGGQLITTRGVLDLVQGQRTPYLLFDVLGGPEILPGAIGALPAHQAGNFNDEIQRNFAQFLQQSTGGNKQMPLIFYCQSNQCWMSYNASLRAIALGYTNVLWYRGGIEAWKAAGQPAQPIRAGFAQ